MPRILEIEPPASPLDRLPEQLVVEGYRRWVAALQVDALAPGESAWSFYAAKLGPVGGLRAISDLGRYLNTLRVCIDCPLMSSPFGASALSRQECVILALVAAAQHDDRDISYLCLENIAHCRRRLEVAAAAGCYAATLYCLGQKLTPVPTEIVYDAVGRPGDMTLH